jgi:hypothetical protein
MNEFQKIGKIWKELNQTKRMRPTGTFFDYLFRSYSSLKMTCLKIKCKNQSDLRPYFHTAVTSKGMVGKGPGLSYQALSRFHLFFRCEEHLYKRLRWSVRRSVGPSVGPSPTMRNYMEN